MDGGEQLQAFAFGHAIVERIRNDKNGGLEVLHELVGRPAIVHGRISPGRSLQFPFGKPQFFGGTVHAGEVVNSVVRDEDLVMKSWIVVVALDPINHVAAVTRAGSSDAVLINIGKPSNLGDAVTDIGEDLSTPIAGNLVDKSLTVAGRAPRVRHERDPVAHRESGRPAGTFFSR